MLLWINQSFNNIKEKMIRINKVKTTKGKTGFSRKTIKKVVPPYVYGENNNLSKTNISNNLNNSNKQNQITQQEKDQKIYMVFYLL